MSKSRIKIITYKGDTYISKTSEDIFELIKEINIYNNLDHPNIPKIKHVLTNNNNTFEFLFDIFENDLRGYMIAPSEFKIFLTEMLLTLHYIHSKGIFHSDVKPHNILLKNKKYYVIDYGLSDFYGFPQDSFWYVGTYAYKAFDLTTRYAIDNNSDFNLDVYSLGVSAVQILTGKVIVDIQADKSDSTLSKMPYLPLKYNKSEVENLIGKEGSDLLENMVGLNNRYISTTEALAHPYINKSVDTYQDIAFKNNFDVKANVNYGNLTEKMFIILINWILEVTIVLDFDKYFEILLSTNKLIRTVLSKKEIDRKSLQLYGSAALFICQSIFSDVYSMDISDIVYITANTYDDKQIELAIIDIMNTVNWKVDMIPYKMYLDYYITKYYQKNSEDYNLVMTISELLLIYLLLHDNNITETLHQLSYYIIEIVIYYKFKKNMMELELYNKVNKIFDFLDTYTDINKDNSMKILANYLKIVIY